MLKILKFQLPILGLLGWICHIDPGRCGFRPTELSNRQANLVMDRLSSQIPNWFRTLLVGVSSRAFVTMRFLAASHRITLNDRLDITRYQQKYWQAHARTSHLQRFPGTMSSFRLLSERPSTSLKTYKGSLKSHHSSTLSAQTASVSKPVFSSLSNPIQNRFQATNTANPPSK